MEPTVEGVLEAIKKMSIIDIARLVKCMESEFGISAAAPVGVVQAAAPGAAKEEDEQQIEFDVVLKSAGATKINVIKVVRELTGLGLKEAKDLVESAPATVKAAISKEEAEKMKSKLQEAGAEIEIK